MIILLVFLLKGNDSLKIPKLYVAILYEMPGDGILTVASLTDSLKFKILLLKMFHMTNGEKRKKILFLTENKKT